MRSACSGCSASPNTDDRPALSSLSPFWSTPPGAAAVFPPATHIVQHAALYNERGGRMRGWLTYRHTSIIDVVKHLAPPDAFRASCWSGRHGDLSATGYKQLGSQSIIDGVTIKGSYSLGVLDITVGLVHRRVMVMEWVTGEKLTKLPQPELRQMVAAGQASFLTQLLEVRP